MKSVFFSLLLVLNAHCQTVITSATLNGATLGLTNSSGGGGGDTAWMTAVSVGTSRNSFDGTVGCTITVNSTITITSMGGWVVSGSAQTHRIGIWVIAAPTVPIAEVSLNKTGLGTGFAYATLGTPVVLTAGTYFFGEEEFSGGDSWYNDAEVTGISTTGVATITTSSFHNGYEAPTSGNSPGVNCFGPINFKYH